MSYYPFLFLLLGVFTHQAFAKPQAKPVKKIDDYHWVNGLGFHKKKAAQQNYRLSWYESKKKIPSLPLMRSFKKKSTGVEFAQLYFNIPKRFQIEGYEDNEFVIKEKTYQNPEGYRLSFLNLWESQSSWRWSSHEFNVNIEFGEFKVLQDVSGYTRGYDLSSDTITDNSPEEVLFIRIYLHYTYTLNFKFPVISKYFVVGPLLGFNPELGGDITGNVDPIPSIGMHYGANFKLFAPMMGHQDLLYLSYRIKFYHMIKSFSYVIENSTTASQMELELGINYSTDNQIAFKYTYNDNEKRESTNFNQYSILDHSYSLIFRF